MLVTELYEQDSAYVQRCNTAVDTFARPEVKGQLACKGTIISPVSQTSVATVCAAADIQHLGLRTVGQRKGGWTFSALARVLVRVREHATADVLVARFRGLQNKSEPDFNVPSSIDGTPSLCLSLFHTHGRPWRK